MRAHSPDILFLTPGELFRQAPDKFIKAVLLENRVGEIKFARLLAMKGGVLPDVHEENGLFNPPSDLLAGISHKTNSLPSSLLMPLKVRKTFRI